MTASALTVLGLAAATGLHALSNPPVGTSIDIHAGSNATPEAAIVVSLTATDDGGVTGYYLSQSPVTPAPGSFTAVSSTTSFDAAVSYTIAGGYGEKTIYAWFIDQENNISQPLWYQISYLDKIAVVDQVLIDGTSNYFDSGVQVVTGPQGYLWVTGFRYANPYFGYGDRAYIAKYHGTTLVREWGESYSSSGGVGTGSTQGLDIAVDGAGNSYTTGFDFVDEQGGTYYYDAFLVKYSTAGVFQWVEPLTTDDGTRTYGYGVALGPAGNVFVVGRTDGTFPGQSNAGGYDLIIARFSSGGTRQWVKQYGTSGSDSAKDIAIDGSGDLYVVGYTYGPLFGATQVGAEGSGDIFLTKLDASGNHIWTRLMGTDRAPESGESVALRNGYVYVGGYAKDTCGCATVDVFLAKYTTTGGAVWTRIFGGNTFNSQEEAFGMTVDHKGEVYLVGDTQDSIDGNIYVDGYDLAIFKYDPDGKRLFSFTYATAGSDRGFGAAITATGKVAVTGYVGGDLLGQSELGHDDVVLMTLDLDGITSVLFADGFESGTLSAWSSSAP